MPKKDTISKDGETYTFECGLCGFTSTNHETKKSAEQRRSEHMAEHEGADPVELATPKDE